MKSTRQRVIIYQSSSSSIFTEGEGEVGSTHTHIYRIRHCIIFSKKDSHLFLQLQ